MEFLCPVETPAHLYYDLLDFLLSIISYVDTAVSEVNSASSSGFRYGGLL